VSAPRLRVVGEDASRRVDPYETRIPAGDYSVALVAEERQTLFGRPTWRTRWRVTDGKHLGAEIYGWWAIPGPRFGPRNAYATAVAIATERRAPRDLARSRPSHFFSECVLLARVRDVARDSNGVERPDGARYSRLAYLLRRLAGAPPSLRGRP
jgi:hypothetical protein